jgi:plastocyanin
MKVFWLSLALMSLSAFGQGKKVEQVIPQRELSVIVTKEGYYPKNLTVFKGEKVKFYVTSTTEEPDCFIVQGHKVFLAAQKGKITEAEVVMENEGEFAFYCPSTKNDGKITVIKNKNIPGRGLAGEQWMPRDY